MSAIRRRFADASLKKRCNSATVSTIDKSREDDSIESGRVRDLKPRSKIGCIEFGTDISYAQKMAHFAAPGTIWETL